MWQIFGSDSNVNFYIRLWGEEGNLCQDKYNFVQETQKTGYQIWNFLLVH